MDLCELEDSLAHSEFRTARTVQINPGEGDLKVSRSSEENLLLSCLLQKGKNMTHGSEGEPPVGL